MAKVKINGLKQVKGLLEDFFKDKIATKEVLEEVGVFARERIQAFTRSGKSIAGERPTRLKRLSESYKDMRRGAVKFRTINGEVVPFPEPDERLQEVDTQFFDPNFSNLTFTGQMLNALRSVVDVTKRQVSIFVNDDRRKGKYEKLTNAEVAKHVADQGRPFLGLDQSGVKRVKQLLIENVRRQIIKSGLKK